MKCGHQLDVGRFCLNCGHPVDDGSWRTDTAERPAITGSNPPSSAPSSPPAITPPPVLGQPREPRYPLYADEVGRRDELGPRPDAPPGGGHRSTSSPGAPRWLPWVAVVAALLLMAVIGVVLLTRDGGDDKQEPVSSQTSSQQDTEPSQTPDPPSPASPVPPEPTGTTGTTPSAPSEPPSEPPAETPDQPTDKPENVSSRATATVPRTAPANQDVNGNQVRYDARNMLDGVGTTCWRMPGDASGESITVALAAPTKLTRVGLINGYAKTSEDGNTTFNWYRGNRRVLSVEWVFDDGTTVAQSLEEVRRLQSIDIDPVTTSSVTLRLITVSSPGTGRSARDYTAISDLALVGVPE